MVIKLGENGITLDLALAYINGGEIEYYEEPAKVSKNRGTKLQDTGKEPRPRGKRK